ncbi:MAG: hypothetical protein ACFFCT_03515 [Candidatus Odinarchaeota archaeon]
MQQRDIERALLLASALMSMNLLIGFVSTLVVQTTLMSIVAQGIAFLEFGLLLVMGSCLMSRQPIENKDRYNDDGSHTTSWRIALIGRQMLLAATFLFLYFLILSIISSYFAF